jgi:class 3 adenylate cyclase
MRAERRIVTALFVDVVHSTSIVEQLDPEDASAFIGELLAVVIEQVDVLRGTVKDLAGDGVLALFGAPTAHEDDAERAVLCGLRAVRAVRQWSAGAVTRSRIPDVAVRVGVETGPAALGPVGGGSRVEYAAVGDAVNIAARLQACAEPHEVLVGEKTLEMIRSRFAWGETRELSLRGRSAPVRAAQALRHEPRADGPSRPFSAALVGRSREQAVLASALRRLASGAGSVIALSGEPGIGKSRLLAEAAEQFSQRLEGVWMEAAAVSYADNVPYLPFRHLLLSWLGVAFDAEHEQIADALGTRADEVPPALGRPLRAVLPMLSETAGVDVSDPQAGRRRIFAAMSEFVAALTFQQPVAVALEDIQWCDPVSLDLARELALLTVRHPLLLVLTSRPGSSLPALVARLQSEPEASVHELHLEAQSLTEARTLLHALVGGAVLPRAVEERLLAVSAGNPLFLEEQVRAMAAAGAIVAQGRGWVFRADVPFVIAPTVQRSLLARIDGLPEPSRDVLVAAAVLGEQFHQSILDALVGVDAAPSLADLVTRQVIQRDGADGRTLRFRHALVQETAYSSLPRRQRRELHARAASALREAYPGRDAEIAATLGRHLAIAEQADEAARLLAIAATRALESFANEEAARLAAEALALMSSDGRPSSDSRRGHAQQLRLIRVAALRRQTRYDEALAALDDALNDCSDGDVVEAARLHRLRGDVFKDAQRYDSALRECAAAEALVADCRDEDAGFEVWLDAQLARVGVYYWLANVEQFDRVLSELAPLVQRVRDVDQRVHYLDAMTAAMLRRERYAPSAALLELSSTAYDTAQTSTNPTTRAWGTFLRGLCLLMCFDAETARPLLADSLAAAEHLGDILLRARALAYMTAASRLSEDVAQTAALLQPARDAAREAGLPEYAAMADAQEAWVSYRRGDLGRASDLAHRALASWETLPTRYFVDWMACMPLFAAALEAGDGRERSRALGAASRMLADTQQRLPGGIDDALRSALRSHEGGDDHGADRSLREALKLAQQRGLV